MNIFLCETLTTTDIFDRLCKAHPTLKKEVTSAKAFGRKLKTIAARSCEREGRPLEELYDHLRGGSAYSVISHNG